MSAMPTVSTSRIWSRNSSRLAHRPVPPSRTAANGATIQTSATQQQPEGEGAERLHDARREKIPLGNRAEHLRQLV